MADWIFQIVTPSGTVLANLVQARQRRVVLALNRAGEASFLLDIDDPVATDTILSAGENDLAVYRDSVPISRGRLWSKTKSLKEDDRDVTVQAVGLHALLDKRIAGKDAPRQFVNEDAGDIAWALIDESQNETGGDLGITQGTIEPSVNRTVAYRIKKVGEAVRDLQDAENGFESEITGDKVFNVYYPQKGTLKEDVIFRYSGAIKSIEEITESSEIVNYVSGFGKNFGNKEIRANAADALSIANYGRREDTANYRDIDETDYLQDKVSGDVTRRKNLPKVYRIVLNTENSFTFPTDFDLGDTCNFKIETDSWNLDKNLRILGIEIEIDEENKETLTLITAEEKIAGGVGRLEEIPTIEGTMGEIGDRVEKLETNLPRGNLTVNVSQFGDADFDDLQTALNYVRDKGGGVVLGRDGTYTIDGLLIYSDVTLVGESFGNFIIKATGNFDSIINMNGGEALQGGTISVSNGSSTVTGVGTVFTDVGTGSVENYFIVINSAFYEIASIESDTSLTLEKVYQGADVSGISCFVIDITPPQDFALGRSGAGRNMGLKNVIIEGVNQANEIGVVVGTSTGSILENVVVRNCGASGFWFFDNELTTFKNVSAIDNEIGVVVASNVGTDNSSVDLRDLIVSNNVSSGILLDAVFASFPVGNARLSLKSNNNGSHGVEIHGCTKAALIDCEVNSNQGSGVSVSDDALNVQVIGGAIIGNGATGFDLFDTENPSIVKTKVAGNGEYGIRTRTETVDARIDGASVFDNASGDLLDEGVGTIVTP